MTEPRSGHPLSPEHLNALLIPVLFFFSGACGLVYEVVWARMLTVLFGTTLFAVSTVLSAFMAGLALGSFLFGRWLDRLDRPLRVFALLEFGIGLFALLFPWIVSGLGRIYGGLHLYQDSFYVFSFIRFLLCFAVLLVPTALMGATLPVVVKFAVPRLSRLGKGVGGLYAINTLGAVAGILLVTFLLMEWLGLKGSTYIAAAVNFLIAGGAWMAGRDWVVHRERAAEEWDARPNPRPIPTVALAAVLGGFALSGFAALGYEVAWMRLLTVGFSANSHYEFSIILTAFLLGLALGSFICSRFLDGRQDLLSLFGGIQLLIGLLGVISIPVFATLPWLIETAKGARTWLEFEGGVFIVSTALMLVPTLLMGATFPLVSRIYTRRLESIGRGVGDVNAINSLGAIGGAFATGFILIPLLGTEWSIKVLAGLNLLAGLAVIGLHPSLSMRRKAVVGAAASTVLAALLAFGPADVLKQVSQPASPSSRLVYYEEGAAGVVTVTRAADGFRKLRVNGGGQVPSDYASLQLFRLLGHLPLLLHPNPQNVLVVSFGGGIALGSVAQHDLRHIDCVEIVPEVMNAARQHFGEFNHHILDHLETSPVRIAIDDGRNFLFASQNPYHVITGDATHPTSADSWVLYTRDFYQLCKDRLTPDGIMAQWLPLHGLSTENYKTILRTFQSVFPHATLWLTNDYTVVLGTLQEVQLDLSFLEQKLRSEKVRQSLEEVNLGDPFALLSCFLMDEESLRAYVGEGPLNTDNHPHVSFLRSHSFKHTGWQVLQDVGRHRVDVFPFVKGVSETRLAEVESRLQAYALSKKQILQADVLRMQRKSQAALLAYKNAVKLNPEDRTAAFFVQDLGRQIIDLYQLHLLDRPNDVEARWLMGNVLAQVGRMEEAEKTFAKIIKMAPNYLRAYLSLSYLYAQKGKPDKAMAMYRRAETIAPDTPQARSSLKTVYKKIRQLGAAE